MTSRRSFLRTATIAATGVAVGAGTSAEVAAQYAANPRVRRNINSLDPAGPEVTALRAGVEAMKALNPAAGLPTNPKSWGYQRGIHRYPPPPPNPLPIAWNTCTHHGVPGPGFVSWHRAYLHYFERICRSVSGYADFTLPYWNYDLPGQAGLPVPFHDSSPTSNALYHANRFLAENDTLDSWAIGEQSAIGIADFSGFQAAVEEAHDNTHVGIGGDMGSVRTSPLDPIFYLHHCNIDRCWRHWQIQHLDGADPSPPPVWWTSSWTFFDESGTQVAMTGQQAEHTPNLGYVYDDEPVVLRVHPTIFPWQPKLLDICRRYPQLCQPLEWPPVPPRPWPFALRGARPVILPFQLPAAQVEAFWSTKRTMATPVTRGMLVMDLILNWQQGSPLIAIEARPAGSPADSGWRRAGTVSSFSRGGERDTVQVDVTQVFDRLDRRTSRTALEWRVRFTSGQLTADGREKPLGDLQAQAQVIGAKLSIPESKRR
jgi:hypothetical protein